MKKIFILMVAACLLVMASCDSDDSGDADGGSNEDENPLVTGENYLTFKADGTDVAFGSEAFDVRFYADENTMKLIGPDGGNEFYLSFPGEASGTFSEEDVLVLYDNDAAQGYPWGWVAGVAYGGSFDLEITECGVTGEWITGTFSGTFAEFHNMDATGNTMTVTDGKFALTRGNDQ